MLARMVGGLAALTIVAAACGGTEPAAAGSGKVGATEKDFSISLDRDTVAAGTVTFNIHNVGPSQHEFVVFRTDLPADRLPLAEGKVDEESSDLESIDEAEDIKPGTTTPLAVTLEPGSYVVICNLPGHYQLGMHAALSVS